MLTAIEANGELFHTAAGTAFTISRSTATEKPSRFEASALEPGCASNTTSAPGMRRALRR